MARRLSLPLVAALLGVGLGAGVAGPRPSKTLVSYSFEDDLDTGPDTFAVFQRAKGRVRLASALRFSGYRSVEIRDVAEDGDFPELQGYFPPRESGKLYAHFALLTADASETFNVALAGPGGFTLGKDGIAFWLLSRDGFLQHTSDSMPKRLFPLRSFVWYLVDVAYDIDAGVYDLVVHEEGSKAPVVSLAAQPNAAHRPGSAVDKFSFIGDTGDDTSNVVYYVDDVVVSADRPVAQSSFVAPGRRKLFVDAWNERQKLARQKPRCLAAVDPADFGIGPGEAALLERDDASAESRRLLEGTKLRQRGCAALEAGKPAEALELFEAAAAVVPDAALYELSAAVALGRLERFDEAGALLARLQPELGNDPRYAQAAAMIGLERDDLVRSDPESYFFVLLWKGSFRRAERLATEMSEREPATWLERVGDAAFLDHEIEDARRAYEESAAAFPPSSLLLSKLSDVYYLLGDLERERELRESVWGSGLTFQHPSD